MVEKYASIFNLYPILGMVGMCLLIATLTLCLVSIWLDGSPFQADYFTSNTTTNINTTLQCESSTSDEFGNESEASKFSFLSVGVLLAGIIAARFGLWVADLTITQLIQENVQEEHSK